MHKLDTGLIYRGFINSYNGFVFFSGDNYNYARETHTIIEYFRVLGASLGYIPYCEAANKQRERADLEWYSDDTIVLHLESENFYHNYPHTVRKLCASKALIRVGILWAKKSHTYKDDEAALDAMAETYVKGNEKHEYLWIVRYDRKIASCTAMESFSPIRAWRIRKGRHVEMLPSYIGWTHDTVPRQTTYWKIPEE